MKLSIITVSWNVREDLVRCLQSTEENRPCCDFEIIVIDNASTDGTVERIKKDFSEVTVIANSENRGFAAANNQGVKLAQGQYLLFLNPDTILHPQSLDIMINFMDSNTDVCVCGPKLLNINGKTQQSVRRFPTFSGVLHRHTAFKFLGVFKSAYKKWLMKDFHYDIQKDVDQVIGAALLTRKSVIEQVGDMDESFFMYYEEVDLCYRIKNANWRIVYLPTTVITHLGGSSANQIPVDKHIMAMTSLVKFFRKHRGKFATGVFILIFKPAIVLKDFINIVTGSFAYIFATAVLNKKNRQKSAAKVKSSIALLSRYSWGSLSKI
jgi:GT2 family glycosyltransferase